MGDGMSGNDYLFFSNQTDFISDVEFQFIVFCVIGIVALILFLLGIIRLNRVKK